MFGKLVTVLIAITLTACGTTKLSSQDHLAINDGQKSIVKTDNSPFLSPGISRMPSTTLLAVDGQVVTKDIFALDDQIAVPIGHHTFDVSCESDDDSDVVPRSQSVNIEILPGREYIISCRAKRDVAVKYRDLKNGQP